VNWLLISYAPLVSSYRAKSVLKYCIDIFQKLSLILTDQHMDCDDGIDITATQATMACTESINLKKQDPGWPQVGIQHKTGTKTEPPPPQKKPPEQRYHDAGLRLDFSLLRTLCHPGQTWRNNLLIFSCQMIIGRY